MDWPTASVAVPVVTGGVLMLHKMMRDKKPSDIDKERHESVMAILSRQTTILDRLAESSEKQSRVAEKCVDIQLDMQRKTEFIRDELLRNKGS